MGDGVKAPQPSEWNTRIAARQKVIAARAIAAGEVLTRDALASARTVSGIPAGNLWDLVGRTSSRSYAAGEVIAE